MSLKPTDLGIFDAEDTEIDNGDDNGPLPQATTLPPPGLDMRTKEGRAWKASQGSGEPYKLTGESRTTGKRASRGNVDHFKKVIFDSHQKLAMVVGDPEFALDEEEAGLLAEKIADVLTYYKIEVKGKGGAFLGLAYAVTMVYGPRFAPAIITTIFSWIKDIRKQKQENASGQPRFSIVP